MVLGDVIGVEACALIELDQPEAVVELPVQIATGAVAMAVFPRSETMFVTWTLAYAFITGLTYAGFSAFVLEAIGRRRGCLTGGGHVDYEKAAGILLRELRSGKLGRISLESPDAGEGEDEQKQS